MWEETSQCRQAVMAVWAHPGSGEVIPKGVWHVREWIIWICILLRLGFSTVGRALSDALQLRLKVVCPLLLGELLSIILKVCRACTDMMNVT